MSELSSCVYHQLSNKSHLCSPRTEASEVTVERILTKLMPSGAQVKEVFNTIPQYAFQDIPEQPR